MCSVHVYDLKYESEHFCKNILCSFLIWSNNFIKIEHKLHSLCTFNFLAAKFAFVRKRGGVM